MLYPLIFQLFEKFFSFSYKLHLEYRARITLACVSALLQGVLYQVHFPNQRTKPKRWNCHFQEAKPDLNGVFYTLIFHRCC